MRKEYDELNDKDNINKSVFDQQFQEQEEKLLEVDLMTTEFENTIRLL